MSTVPHPLLIEVVPERIPFPRYVGPADNGQLMTPEEFDAIEEYDELYLYELIEGVLIVSELTEPSEADPNDELGYLLRSFAETHPGIFDRTLYGQYIRITRSRRRADRVVWIGLGRVPRLKCDVPAIAVDFVSARKQSWQRDYAHKREEYLAAGVKEYWLFDRFQRQLSVFQSTDAGITTTVIPSGGTYTSPLLPGFELPIDRLLKCADDWIAMESEDGP